jgi:phytanoyl-CoA hydroxylase
MMPLHTPRGLSVEVPENAAEDPSPKFELTQAAQIARYYDENGYVIVRGAVPAADCDAVRELWEREVKPSGDFIYRQATAKAERHVLNAQGWVMNPILNLQSVDPNRYPKFRAFATQRILTASALIKAFQIVLREKPKLVQSMYFEGNSATWEHQDSYYLDSERVGSMAAAWLAVEDIAPQAGRFFICPGSHKIDLDRQSYQNNIADNHEVYIQSVVRKIRELGLGIRAPCLMKGDVLFWNAWTIHGSLDSQDAAHARSSITCHAIPESHRFLQHQTHIKKLDLSIVNGVSVHSPKDLARLRNRLIFWVETHFPELFYATKRNGVRLRFILKAAHQG